MRPSTRALPDQPCCSERAAVSSSRPVFQRFKGLCPKRTHIRTRLQTYDGKEAAEQSRVHYEWSANNSRTTHIDLGTVSVQVEGLRSRVDSSSYEELMEVLETLAAADFKPDPAFMEAVIPALLTRLEDASPRELARACWAISNIDFPLHETWVNRISELVLSKREDFFAPDLCQLVCALGGCGIKPRQDLVVELTKEVQFQVREFMSDFSGVDLARVVSGMADLEVEVDEEFHRLIMKAVYTNVREIGEKGAVDFALAKLDSSEKSMHFDPRWTHEELHWLPRRERDKRRILKDGWYRSKWTGWTS